MFKDQRLNLLIKELTLWNIGRKKKKKQSEAAETATSEGHVERLQTLTGMEF